MLRREAAVVSALSAVLVLSSCTKVEESTSGGALEAAHVEAVDEARDRLTLTAKAVERLGLQTAAVRPSTAAGRSGRVRLSVPYAAVVFTADGRSWSYAALAGNSFLRVPVTVDSVEGELALLVDGPAVGSRVVTAGAAELYGTEFDVGH